LKKLKLIGEIGGIVGALMVATNTPLSGYGFIFFTASSVAWSIAAWRKKYHDLVEEHDVLLVKKPEITNCSLGYPTIWDEENAEIS
jgi:hypothetical protein